MDAQTIVRQIQRYTDEPVEVVIVKLVEHWAQWQEFVRSMSTNTDLQLLRRLAVLEEKIESLTNPPIDLEAYNHDQLRKILTANGIPQRMPGTQRCRNRQQCLDALRELQTSGNLIIPEALQSRGIIGVSLL